MGMGVGTRLAEEKWISVASNILSLFFFALFGLNDDTIAHLGHAGAFRIALVLVPGLFVEPHVHRPALGRFDFDMGCVDGHNRAEHMLIRAMGEAWRRNDETRESDNQA